ncbi:MAG: PaaI family thioesterase [Acidimicrobiia bacterium]|nr:PaaI family thioesterase [Acidimicrobiia bacterium]
MSEHPRESLNAELRRLIHLVRAFDGSDEAADAASEIITSVSDLLEPDCVPGPFMQSGLAAEVHADRFALGDPMEIFPYSPVVGRRNPLAPPVHLWTEGDELYGRVVMGPAYVGPPRSVHGGIVALLFDELLGSTTVINRIGAPTGTLTVVYRSFTPAGEQLDLHAWIDRVEGRKIFVMGEIHHGDTLCAEAEGIFIEPSVAWQQEPPFGGR